MANQAVGATAASKGARVVYGGKVNEFEVADTGAEEDMDDKFMVNASRLAF